jgi:hypothetical protein
MNKKILGIFASLLIVAILAVPIVSVSAEKPMQITGKWRATGTSSLGSKIAGSNRISWSLVEGVYFEGPMDGDFVHIITTIRHYGNPEQVGSYEYNWKMERTFEGTVTLDTVEKEGTLLIHLNAKGISGGTPGTLKGTWVIISGTGDLVNLHGRGTFTNFGMGVFSYEGQIHFDP